MRTLITILTILILTSCTTQDSKIIGEWKVAEVYELENDTIGDDLGLTFTFNSDNTFTTVSMLIERTSHGTWNLSESSLNMIFEGMGTAIFEIESQTDSTLVWTSNYSGSAVRYSLIKE